LEYLMYNNLMDELGIPGCSCWDHLSLEFWYPRTNYPLPMCSGTHRHTTNNLLILFTLQRKPHICIHFLRIAKPISTFMCLWAIYIGISRISPHISCSRIGRSIVGILKPLTDTWMWKSGLRPRNSFSGNICLELSVLVLCSAG
jgi:hypothetical protein